MPDAEPTDRAVLDTRTFAGPAGLYPCPLGPRAPPAAVAAACGRFQFLGRLVGRALLDGFRLPLPLHPCFWDVVLGRQPAEVAQA
jgi:hypothetical protein